LLFLHHPGKRGYFEKGTSILQIARQLGVDLDSVCGGRGICSKCQITPSYGEFTKHGVTVAADALSEWNKVEERYNEKRGLAKGRRLGCQACVQGDVVIDVPAESQVHKQVIRKDASARPVKMNPATRLYYVKVAEPDMHEPNGDLERLKIAIKDQWEIYDVELDFFQFTKLQKTLRQGHWAVTVAIFNDHTNTPPRIVEIWPGLYEESLYGLAIDLGSTTIAAHLTDLKSGEVLKSAGLMNPQIRFGEDLMSRVSYSMMNSGGDKEMTIVVREAIDSLAEQLRKETGIEKNSLVEVVFVCNPSHAPICFWVLIPLN